ncbi:MAG: hypothetical protein L6266_00760, partial [Nanoarchaeota archaeon]|nr:hypothetical protein [Nanoarchaeota archaeon]
GYEKGALLTEPSNVLLLHFNNDSSVGENRTYVYDWSGNNNHATVLNTTYNSTGGKFDGGYEFYMPFDVNNPENESIEVQDSDSLDLSTEGTVEIWVKPSLKSTSTYKIWSVLSKGDHYYDEEAPYSLLIQSTNYGPSCKFYLYLVNNLSQWQSLQTTETYNCDGSQWYHIVATWNGSIVNLYVNGTLDISAVQTKIPFNSDRKLRIGKNSITGLTYNGTIDELAIYNRALTAEEIAIHAGIKPNNTAQTWTINNINDGNFKYNCLSSDNTSESNFSSSNYSFYVDVNPPIFLEISHNPSSLDDLDPNTLINVTANISEPFTATLILQYKSQSATFWTNKTMVNTSLNFFESNFTPSTEGNWSYRIYANDSNGHINISSITTLNIKFDYTWTWNRSTSDLGTITGFLGTTKSIGVITIENTGEFDLTFDLENNAPYGMTYDVPEPFDLAPKNSKQINVNATFASIIREDSVTIIINATQENADPPIAYVNVTLASYAGGPYLDVKISDYTATINQTDSMTLSGYLQNLGNETATNVSFNWTLPTGWSNSSGNLSIGYGNIAPGSTKYYNTITANVSNLATAGMNIIVATVSCIQNNTDNHTVSIQVNCFSGDGVCGAGCTYLTDTECTKETIIVTTSGGGTGGSPGPSLGKVESKEISKVVHIVRGEKGNFTIDVENTFKDSILENLTLELSGFLVQYVTVTPNKLSNIKFNQSKAFIVTIAVPAYLEHQNYTLTATISGIIKDNTNVTKFLKIKEYISLVIHDISKTTSSNNLDKARKAVEEMENAGFIITKTLKLLEEAEDNLAIDEYESSFDLSTRLLTIKEKAFATNDLINEIKDSMDVANKKGLTFTESLDILNLAIAAFEREDFDIAEQRANDAELSFNLEIQGQFNLLWFLLYYWWAILLGLIMFSAISYFAYLKFMMYYIKQKLKNLANEELSIVKLIKETQKNASIDKSITSTQYFRSMAQYSDRLRKIRILRTKLRSIRIGIIKIAEELKILEKENQEIRILLRKTQEDYYQTRKLSKRDYENAIEAGHTRVAEIEEAKALLNAKIRINKMNNHKGLWQKIKGLKK